MDYQINGHSLSEYGIVPISTKGNDIALTGVFDLPKRLGTIEHEFGNETEAFVKADDIILDGRELKLNCYARAATSAELISNLQALFNECEKDGTVLTTPFGTFNVSLRNQASVSEFPKNKSAQVEIRFWQEDYVIPSQGETPNGGDGYLIDNYNLKTNFGVIMARKEDFRSLSKRKDFKYTAEETSSALRTPRDMVMQCYMVAPDLTTFKSKMDSLHALLISPDLRVLIEPNNTNHYIYVKDGLKVDKIRNMHRTIAYFNLKLREPNP